MKRNNKYLIIFTLILLFLGCGISKKMIFPIETENRSFSLYSLRNTTYLYTSPICDSTMDKKLYDSMVKKELESIYKNLLSELRRCAKFGIYTVTDSIQPHEVSIILEFMESSIQNDSILIPFKVLTIDRETKQKEVKVYNLKTLIPKYQITDSKSKLYSAGRALLSYRKLFPYHKIISRYYNNTSSN